MPVKRFVRAAGYTSTVLTAAIENPLKGVLMVRDVVEARVGDGLMLKVPIAVIEVAIDGRKRPARARSAPKTAVLAGKLMDRHV